MNSFSNYWILIVGLIFQQGEELSGRGNEVEGHGD